MNQIPQKKISFWLKWFPEFCRSNSKKVYKDLGQTKNKWFPSRTINIEEKTWDHLARIKIFLKPNSEDNDDEICLYGETLEEIKNHLKEAVIKVQIEKTMIESKTAEYSFMVYNLAHKVKGSKSLFSCKHPYNEKYKSEVSALFHENGLTSILVKTRIPWRYQISAYPPGFFKALQTYLTQTQKDKT